MKKIIIIVSSLLAVAGLSVGSLFLYKYFGEQKYDYEDRVFEFCEDSSIEFDEEGFSVGFLKPSFESSDEDVFTIDEDGNIETYEPGEAYVTAKGLMFESTGLVIVKPHEGTIKDCDEAYECLNCKEDVFVKGGHQFTELTCLEDSYCTICGEVKETHRGHQFAPATCENPKTCTECHITEGEPLGHTWVEVTCTMPAYCSVCLKNGDAPIGHDFTEATCEQDSYCTRCNEPGEEKALGHNMLPATCTAPSTCERCGLTKGKELGHKAGTVKCLEPTYCTRCNEMIEEAKPHNFAAATCTSPKKCKRCGLTEGSATGHTVVEATCKRGSYCSVCNKSLSSALDHVYVQNESGKTVCAYCGKSFGYDPGYSSAGNADLNAYAYSVLEIVNQERAAVGLNALSMDSVMCQAANIRAEETTRSFSHTRPDGRRCFTALDDVGYRYGYAGENIAYGYSTPESVMYAWMHSEGHKANILNSNYNKLGVGVYYYNGIIYCTQFFSS